MTHKYLSSSSLLVLALSLSTPLSAMIIPEADAGLPTRANAPLAENIIVQQVVAPVAVVAPAPAVIEAPVPAPAAQAAPAVVHPQAEAAPKAKSASWWPFGSSSSSTSTTAQKEDVKAAIAEGVTALRAQHDDSVEDQFKEAGGAESLLTKSIFIEPQFQQQVKALIDAKDQDATLKAVDALRAKTLKRKGTTPEEQEQASQTVQAIVTEKAIKQGWASWLWSFFVKADVTPAAMADKKDDVVEMASVPPAAEAVPAVETKADDAEMASVAPTQDAAPAAEVATTATTDAAPVAAETPDAPVSETATPATTEAPAAPVAEAVTPAAPTAAPEKSNTWFLSWFFKPAKKGDALAEVVAGLKDSANKTGVEVVDTAAAPATVATSAAETAGPDAAPSLSASLIQAHADKKAGKITPEEYNALRSSLVQKAVAVAKPTPMQIDGRLALDTASTSTTAEPIKAHTIIDIEDLEKGLPHVPVDTAAKAEQHAADYIAFGHFVANAQDTQSVAAINAALEEAASQEQQRSNNDAFAALFAEVNETPATTDPVKNEGDLTFHVDNIDDLTAALDAAAKEVQENAGKSSQQKLTFAQVAKMPALKKPMFTLDPDLFGSVMSELKAATSKPQAQPAKTEGTTSFSNIDDDSELNGAASITSSLVDPVEDVAATIHGYKMSKAEHEAYVIFSADKVSANAKRQINKTIRENIAGGVHVSTWPQSNRFYYLQHPNKESFGPLAKGMSVPVKLKNS